MNRFRLPLLAVLIACALFLTSCTPQNVQPTTPTTTTQPPTPVDPGTLACQKFDAGVEAITVAASISPSYAQKLAFLRPYIDLLAPLCEGKTPPTKAQLESAAIAYALTAVDAVAHGQPIPQPGGAP